MAAADYYVVLHQGRWQISYEGKHYGFYRTQTEAIADAIESAHGAGKQGHDAQVLVQGSDNKFRAEWIYKYDPYPPKR